MQEQMFEGKILFDIVLGQDSVLVMMVEYVSFICLYCVVFYNENLFKLKVEYIDIGKIKFIQCDVYFDVVGLWVGIFVCCGGDEKYYFVLDMLFEEQKIWLDVKFGDDIVVNLCKIGVKVGMMIEQMDVCWVDKQKVVDLVVIFQKNVIVDNVEGMFSFVIGGEKVQNQLWDVMKKIIDVKIVEVEKQG